MQSRVILEIDLDKLVDNFLKIRKHVNNCAIMPILKANAYGIGVRDIAKKLIANGVEIIGVAELNEALELADLGVKLQILGNILPQEIPEVINLNMIVPLNDFEMAKSLNDEAIKQNKVIEGAILIDSGMGRLGLLSNDSNTFDEIVKMNKLSNLKIVGIYSHFSSAYNKSDDFTFQQFDNFKQIYNRLIENGFSFKYVHIGASDAINNFNDSFSEPFNLVRCGINLYGYADENIKVNSMNLQGIVNMKTFLASVRELPANYSIGYGRMHKLCKNSKVGTIAAGYADGLPLALSNRGYVIINGVICPILGRISMDYTTVLLDNVADAKVGDEVICIGGDSDHEISLDDWAKFKGTHIYDILCSIGGRVERRFINN